MYIYLISISDSVSNGSTKTQSVLKQNVNSVNEFEPNVLNTVCATRFKKLKILQKGKSSLMFLSPKILQLLKDNFSLNIAHKELRIPFIKN